MSTYQALRVTEASSDYRSAGKIVELPVPKASAGHVLVKNTAVCVAAYDVLVLENRFVRQQEFPFTAGLEAVGVVAEVGEGVDSVVVGESVTYIAPGAFAEYTVVPVEAVVKVPSSAAETMSFTSAVWALASLEEAGEMKSGGETVFVTAAAGGTGQYVVQLAKKAGNAVIGMTSSDRKADFLRGLGCDRVINYSVENVSEVLSKEFPNGINLLFDSVGGDLLASLVPHLAMYGRVIAFGTTSGYSAPGGPSNSEEKDEATLNSVLAPLISKCASIRGISLTAYPEPMERLRPKVLEMFEKGELRDGMDDVKFVGLDSILDALEYVMARKNIGKVAVKIQDLP